MSTAATAQVILNASQQFTIYVGFTIMFTGVLGHMINIIVLTSSRQFRNNQAAFYLTVESAVDIVQLIIPLSSRIAVNGFGNDLTKISLLWCKMRQCIVSSASLIAFHIICLASYDQYLSTSHYPHIRSLSSLKQAHRLTFIAIILWPLHGISFLVFMEIDPTPGCFATNSIFNIYYSYVYLLILMGLLPIVFSCTFSILAYVNVRRIVRRQIPIYRRRLEKQLTAMILARVGFLTVVTLPFIIQRIYTLQMQISPEDVIHRAIVQLLGSITFLLSYLHSAVSKDEFYLISSSWFTLLSFSVHFMSI